MGRTQSYLLLGSLGLFVGTGSLLLQQRSSPQILHHVDIAPTRRVEVANACALIEGRFLPRVHNALDESYNPVQAVAMLPGARPPATLSYTERSAPCLFELNRGLVLSLGTISLGGKDFCRLVDESGGIKLIGSDEIIASAKRAWAIPGVTPAVDVDLDKAAASVSALWHDFGVVERNSIQVANFTIRNSGDIDIKAEGFHTSCGCITLSIEPRKTIVIPANDRLDIRVRVEFGDIDDLSQTFRISLSSQGTSPPADLIVRVFGSTPRSPAWSPKTIDYGLVDSIADSPTRRIRISEIVGDRLEISSIKATGPIEFRFNTATQSYSGLPADHVIQCVPLGGIDSSQLGDFLGEIVISTTSLTRKEIRVPYRLTLRRPDVTALHEQ